MTNPFLKNHSIVLIKVILEVSLPPEVAGQALDAVSEDVSAIRGPALCVTRLHARHEGTAAAAPLRQRILIVRVRVRAAAAAAVVIVVADVIVKAYAVASAPAPAPSAPAPAHATASSTAAAAAATTHTAAVKTPPTLRRRVPSLLLLLLVLLHVPGERVLNSLVHSHRSRMRRRSIKLCARGRLHGQSMAERGETEDSRLNYEVNGIEDNPRPLESMW